MQKISKNDKNDKNDKNKSNDKYILILEAAMKVFAENGFHNSTVSQIAREAGVADGTIYLYFKNKQDILSHFFTNKAKQVFDSFEDAVSKEKNPIDKLRALIKRQFEEFQKDLNMAIVYRSETRQSNHPMEKYIKEMTKKYLDLVASIVEQGQHEGTMRQDLYISIVKRFVLGAVEEMINVWVISGGKYDLVSQADPLVELFLKGIGLQQNSQ